MAEPLRPNTAKVFLRTNVIFIPTIASATLAPTAAEATGASSLDITNIAFADGMPFPTFSTNVVEAQKRFGDGVVGKSIGLTSVDIGELTYQFNQQGVAASNEVKAWEKFLNVSGATVSGYLAYRYNVPKATTPVAGQFVDVYAVEIGPSLSMPYGDGEAAEGGAKAVVAATGSYALKIAILA